jgi:hypothetical protein
MASAARRRSTGEKVRSNPTRSRLDPMRWCRPGALEDRQGLQIAHSLATSAT